MVATVSLSSQAMTMQRDASIHDLIDKTVDLFAKTKPYMRPRQKKIFFIPDDTIFFCSELLPRAYWTIKKMYPDLAHCLVILGGDSHQSQHYHTQSSQVNVAGQIVDLNTFLGGESEGDDLCITDHSSWQTTLLCLRMLWSGVTIRPLIISPHQPVETIIASIITEANKDDTIVLCIDSLPLMIPKIARVDDAMISEHCPSVVFGVFDTVCRVMNRPRSRIDIQPDQSMYHDKTLFHAVLMG